MKKVIVCIHGVETLDFNVYANHLCAVLEASKNFEIGFCTVRGVKVAQARNEICKSVEDVEADYLFFLDTDHIIPDNTIELLAQHLENGYSIASGLVCRRLGDFTTIGYNHAEDGSFKKLFMKPNGKCYPVDICAFGCTLINKEDLFLLPKPIFRDTLNINRKGKEHNLRSDINLCMSLKKLGKKAVIDSRVLVGHVSEPLIVFPQNADQLRILKYEGQLKRPPGYSTLSEMW